MRAAKALAGMCICTDSHEPSLFAGAMSTKTSGIEPENTSEYHHEISQYDTQEQM